MLVLQEQSPLIKNSNNIDSLLTLFFSASDNSSNNTDVHVNGETVVINPETGMDNDYNINPDTGLDRSIVSEVATNNENCQHDFNLTPFGYVDHSSQDSHNWSHEPQQSYEDGYNNDCNYCDRDVTNESVNVKLKCSNCEHTAHVDCVDGATSEHPSKTCDANYQNSLQQNSNSNNTSQDNN